MQAQYSVPFMLATAAVHGIEDPRRLDARLLADPAVLALCRTIAISEASDATGWDATLTVTLADGRRIDIAASRFPGMPETPMDSQQLGAKLEMLLRDDFADVPAAAAQVLRLAAAEDVAAAFEDLFPA